jgi:hypothetical protein
MNGAGKTVCSVLAAHAQCAHDFACAVQPH